MLLNGGFYRQENLPLDSTGKSCTSRTRSNGSDGTGNVRLADVSGAIFFRSACTFEIAQRMNCKMAILSIQSRVTSGYVGNAAATPALQRLGHTVWPIDTVTFSNHPAHGSHTGSVVPAPKIRDLVDGLEAHGCFADCGALLSGYLGSAQTGSVILETAKRVRHTNKKMLWFCDPVMGDNGKFYVTDGIPDFFRDQALAAADVILPNVFEAAYLSGVEIDTLETAKKAAFVLLNSGPKTVVITGVRVGTSIGAIAATATGIWKCMGPEARVAPSGAGDVFSALFAGNYLRSRDTATALSHAVTGVHAILQETAAPDAPDLCLIRALPKLDDLVLVPAETVC